MRSRCSGPRSTRPGGDGRSPAASVVRSGPALLPRPSNLVAAIASRPLGMEEHAFAGRRVGRTTQTAPARRRCRSPESRLFGLGLHTARPNSQEVDQLEPCRSSRFALRSIELLASVSGTPRKLRSASCRSAGWSPDRERQQLVAMVAASSASPAIASARIGRRHVGSSASLARISNRRREGSGTDFEPPRSGRTPSNSQQPLKEVERERGMVGPEHPQRLP